MAATANLLEGPIGPTLRKLSVPMGVGVIFMVLVGLIDTYWASRLGTEELAAMSFAFPIIGVVINVSLGLMIGTSVAVARTVGEGDDDKARRLATHALLLGLLIVAVVAGLGIATQDLVFSALGAPPELVPIIRRYMTIWYASVAVLVVPMMLNGVLRARGDAITPRNMMILSALLNAVLDPILIFGWGPIPGYGLEGAALATAGARLVTFVYAGFIATRLKVLDLHLPSWAELWGSWKTVLHVGIPATVTNVLGPVATALLTAIVALHGPEAVAAYGIGARVESLVLIAPMALSSGLSPFIGQNWGAHLQERVAEGFRMSVKFSALWGFAGFVILLPTAGWIGRLFSDDPVVAGDIALYLRVVPLGYAGYGVMTMTSSAFNAMDHAVRSTMLSVLRSLVIAVPVAWVGSKLFGLAGTFAGLTIGSLVAAAVGLGWMRRFLADGTTRADAPKDLQGEAERFLLDGTGSALQSRMRELIEAMESFADVELHMARADAVGFYVQGRQIGHIHPSGHVDLPLPQELGAALVLRGLVEPHRMHPSEGWYTHPLRDADDHGDALWLLRLGHLLTSTFCATPDEDRTADERCTLELDGDLNAALEIAAARWERRNAA